MPRIRRQCPAFARSPGLRSLPWVAACLIAAAPVAAEQVWSTHVFGITVGEFRLIMNTRGAQYTGTGVFRTTGLADMLRHVAFSVRGDGIVRKGRLVPRSYRGRINTGRRVSETQLEMADTVPRLVSGKDQPAIPIPADVLKGAKDPFAIMAEILLDRSGDTPCTFREKVFDGTRVAEIALESATRTKDRILCSGTYTRIGGYSQAELDEMTVSPISVTYSGMADAWRAERIEAVTRQGKATLIRRQ